MRGRSLSLVFSIAFTSVSDSTDAVIHGIAAERMAHLKRTVVPQSTIALGSSNSGIPIENGQVERLRDVRREDFEDIVFPISIRGEATGHIVAQTSIT